MCLVCILIYVAPLVLQVMMAGSRYVELCKQYSVIPDAGVLNFFKFDSSPLKPCGNISALDLHPLFDLLINNQKVTDIDFSNCRLGPEGAKLCQILIETNSHIRSLNLNHCGITDTGALYLAQALSSGCELKDLQLRGNGIYMDGAFALADALPQSNLMHLDLSNNNMGKPGIKSIRHAAQKLSQQKNKSGLSIDLESNFLYPELFNSISHGLGVIIGVIALTLLHPRANHGHPNEPIFLFACWTYSLSLILLYLASTLYHSFYRLRRVKKIFRILDHSAIYILIAGSYTPFVLITLKDHIMGVLLAIFVWVCALIGVVLAAMFRTTKYYDRLSISLYCAMGWIGILAAGPMINIMPLPALIGVIAGGLLYSIGVVFFLLDHVSEWFHPTFHVFVLLGSLCHLLNASNIR